MTWLLVNAGSAASAISWAAVRAVVAVVECITWLDAASDVMDGEELHDEVHGSV